MNITMTHDKFHNLMEQKKVSTYIYNKHCYVVVQRHHKKNNNLHYLWHTLTRANMTNSPWRLLIYIFTIIPSHCTKLLHVCTGVHGHMYIFTTAHLYSILGNPGKLPEIFCKINTMRKPLPSFRHLSSFDKQTQSFRVTSLFPPRNTFFVHSRVFNWPQWKIVDIPIIQEVMPVLL